MPDSTSPKGNGAHNKVVFNYIKSNQFRVIHVDGVTGSVVPTQHIHMALFNERVAIPQRIATQVNDNGTLGKVIDSETVSKEGIVREVEASVLMNLRAAEAIRDWLTARIDEYKKLAGSGGKNK